MEHSSGRLLSIILRYGWLVLGALLIFTVLVNFNVFEYNTSTCTLSDDIVCTGFSHVGNEITVTVENLADTVLLGVDVAVTGCSDTIKGKTVNRAAEESFFFPACTLDDQFETDLFLTYIDTAGKTHQIKGKIVKKTDLFRITS